MTKFAKMYQNHKNKNNNDNMSREGYGYIKRRVGLLSNEIQTPSYSPLTKQAESIPQNTPKS